MAARPRHARILVLLVVLALAAGLVWGLAGAVAGDSSPSPAGDTVMLKVGWTTDPDNLNPFVGIEQSSYELYHVAYDFLTNYGDKYLETQPGLAESWTTSDDGLTWTFKIRQGVMWSDGQPLTAKDVAFSFNYQKDLELTAFLSALDGIKTVTAPDDATVVIECDRPKADILSMWVPIVPEHIWSKFKTYDEATKYLNEPPIVGSGPFVITEREKGKFIRAEANEDYWGGKPKVDEIIFQVYDNQDTLAQDLKLGAIDLAVNIPPAQVKALKGQEGLASEACSQKAFDYLSFNCYEGPSLGNPVLKDVKFRQALNWAVDKDKLTALAYQTYADPATSIFEVDFYDPNLDWHWEPPADVAYTFDLEKARQALADAGYKDTDGDGILNDAGNGGKNIKLRLWSRQESAQSQVMGKLITGWWEDLGLDIVYSVRGQRHAHRRRLQLRRRHVQAGLRHLHLGVAAERVGPRPQARLLPHRADREPERRLLVQQGVRPAVGGAVRGARPAEAQGDRLPDAGDPVRGVSVHHPHVSQAPRGVGHRRLGGLAAHPAAQRRRRVHQRQREQLLQGHAQGRGDDDRVVRGLEHDAHRHHRGRGRRGRGRRPAAPAAQAQGRGGLSGGTASRRRSAVYAEGRGAGGAPPLRTYVARSAPAAGARVPGSTRGRRRAARRPRRRRRS